jgi:hypothetical protein
VVYVLKRDVLLARLRRDFDHDITVFYSPPRGKLWALSPENLKQAKAVIEWMGG